MMKSIGEVEFGRVAKKKLSSIIHNGQKVRAIQMSIKNEWIHKMWYVHSMKY